MYLKHACGVVTASRMGSRAAAIADRFRASLDARNETIVSMATDVNMCVGVVSFAGANEKSIGTFLMLDNLGCMICLFDEIGYSTTVEMTPRIGIPQPYASFALQREMWWWCIS